MIVVYSEERQRFEAVSSYFEKDIPRQERWRWDATVKRWYAGSEDIARRLAQYAQGAARLRLAQMSPEEAAALAASTASDSDLAVPAPPGLDYLPYQRAGIAYALMDRGGAGTLMACEMGLGKTIQAIGLVNMLPEARRVLIVTPASLRLNWAAEWRRWHTGKLRPHLLDVWPGGGLFDETSGKALIVSYDSVQKWHPQIAQTEFDLLIMDEAHLCKDEGSRRAKSIFGGRYTHKDGEGRVKGRTEFEPIQARRKLMLSGTPIVNRPAELWPLVKALAPDGLGSSRVDFLERYTGPDRLAELHLRLRSTCLAGDTLVSCEDGNISIADIVSRELPVRVWSRDPLGRLSLQPVVGFSARSHREVLTKIRFAEGELVCTGDHRIYTGKGEVRADQITQGDYLLSLRPARHSPTHYESRDRRQPDVLLHELRREGEGAAATSRIYSTQDGNRADPCEGVRTVRGDVRGQELREIPDEAVLLGPLPRQAHLPEIRGAELPVERPGEAKEARDNHGPAKPAAWGCAWADIHPDQAKNVCLGEGQMGSEPGDEIRPSQAPHPIHPGKPKEAANPATRRAGSRVGLPRRTDGCTYPTRGEDDICRHPHWQCGCGNRRGNTHAPQTASEGSGEGCRIEHARVLGIEGVELGGGREIAGGGSSGTIVYDIEVENNHNFFANGVLVHNCMVRRKKEDVLKDLPSKRRQIVLLDVPNAESILAAEAGAISMAQALIDRTRTEIEGLSHAEQVMRLRQCRGIAMTEIARVRKETAIKKLPQAIEHINDILGNADKVVVFSHHHECTDTLQREFHRIAVKLDGRDEQAQRQQAVDSFQQDRRVRVFLGGLRAAGLGITLTAASVVVFVELDWTPAAMMQAEDRLHRIGQINPVLVQHLVIDGSIDSKMAKILIDKQAIMDAALDGGSTEVASRDILSEVLRA